MKKIIAAVAIFLFTAGVFAEQLSYHEISAEYGIIKASWSPFQLAFFPTQYGQLVSGKANIYGLAIGVFVLAQENAAVSVSLTAGQNYNYGLQVAGVAMLNMNHALSIGALTSIANKNHGLQIGCINIELEDNTGTKKDKSKFSGLQIGAINISRGFQIGVINYNPNAYIPVLPIFNFSK